MVVTKMGEQFPSAVRDLNEEETEVVTQQKSGMDEQYPFPFAIRDLNEEEKEVVAELGMDELKGKVKLIGSRAACSSLIRKWGTELYNFRPRPDDIWAIGFPRSGTTIIKEIIYLLGTDLNYEKASSVLMDLRFPMLHMELTKDDEGKGINAASPEDKESFVPVHVALAKSKGRRFIKSHYGFNLLHPKILEIGCKVIFIARNPKDVVASFSRFPSMDNPGFDFGTIWRMFKYDLICCANYFEVLQEAWNSRNNPNLLILFYEDLNTNKRAAISKIAHFLDKKLTNDQLKTMCKHVDIESFKENKSLNNDHLVEVGIFKKNENFSFIRKGKIGGWRDVIPKEFVGEIDEWILKNFAEMPDFEIPEAWKVAMGMK